MMASKCIFHLIVALWISQKGISTQNDSYPLGIGLGPSQITAARFNSKGQPEEVARVTGSPAYQAYMDDVLKHEGLRKLRRGEWFIQDGDVLFPAPPDTHDKEDARNVFSEALDSVSKAAGKALGVHKVTIGAVSAPQYFNGSSRHAVMLALQDVEPKLRQLHQVVVGSHATRLAYGLNSCQGFGLGSQKCDIEDGTHYVLVVELEKRYLQLSLLDVGSDTVETLNQTRFKKLGEDHSATQVSGEDETYYRLIQDELRAFMINNNVGPKQKTEDFLQAVIISGEASDASFEHLRPLIKEILDNRGKGGLLRDTVQPAFVLAVGAAYQAMIWEKSPELLDDVLDTNFVDVPGGIHDEL